MSIISEVPARTAAQSDLLEVALPEIPPLADVLLEPLVRNTLQEDLGRAGDLTSNYIIPVEARASLRLAARERGVVAGLDLARLAFRLMDPDRKSTRLNSSHVKISYAVFCLNKK